VIWAVLLPAVLEPQSASERDSAGIAVLTVQARALESLPRWTLDTLLLEIGRNREEPEYQLHLAAAPWRLSDGRIVAANQQYEIRFYDAGGRHLRTVGRRGRGPGEYQQLWSILPISRDSLLAFDFVRGVSRLDPSGQFVRAMPWQVTSLGLPIVLLPDATLLLADDNPSMRRLQERHGMTFTGLFRDTALIIRTTPDGQAGDTLDIIPGQWWQFQRGNYGGLLLSSGVFLAARGSTIVAGDGAAFAIRWYDPATGDLQRITRVNIQPGRGTRALADRLLAFERARYGNRVPPSEGPPLDVRFAERLPLIELARVDAQGMAWIRRWGMPDEANAEWIVFDRTGRPEARITMPSGLRVSQIENDFVLGIFRDPDGVDSISRYRLRRTR